MWRNVLGTETASISYFSIFGEKELLMLKKRLRGMGNAESLGRLCPRRFCTGKMMTILYGTPSPHLLRKQNPSFHTTGIPMPFILRKAEPPSVSSPSGWSLIFCQIKLVGFPWRSVYSIVVTHLLSFQSLAFAGHRVFQGLTLATEIGPNLKLYECRKRSLLCYEGALILYFGLNSLGDRWMFKITFNIWT